MTRFRYLLERAWSVPPMGAPAQRRTILWVLLNPSTAGVQRDDNTVRRVVSFSKSWGYTDLKVCNLYGRIATKPADLWSAHRHTPDHARLEDVIGLENDRYLFRAAWGAEQIVVGWGAAGKRARARVDQVLKMLSGTPSVAWAGRPIGCLGMTIDGHPRHPLYLRRSTELEPFVREQP